jgi:hypothetical protein
MNTNDLKKMASTHLKKFKKEGRMEQYDEADALKFALQVAEAVINEIPKYIIDPETREPWYNICDRLHIMKCHILAYDKMLFKEPKDE